MTDQRAIIIIKETIRGVATLTTIFTGVPIGSYVRKVDKRITRLFEMGIE